MIFRNHLAELKLVEKPRLFALSRPIMACPTKIRVSSMESRFAACLNGLLQQNRHEAAIPAYSSIEQTQSVHRLMTVHDPGCVKTSCLL